MYKNVFITNIEYFIPHKWELHYSVGKEWVRIISGVNSVSRWMDNTSENQKYLQQIIDSKDSLVLLNV